MKRQIRILIIALFMAASPAGLSQGFNAYDSFRDSPNRYQGWRGGLSAGLILGTVGGFYIFTRPIYYDEKSVPFHFSRHPDGHLTFFENDRRGLDKFGHIFSTSLFAQNIYFLSRWSGFSNKTASYLGAGLGIAIMTGMEVHDGLYERWGFSVGDFLANIVGGVFPVVQQNIPFLRHFDYKLSYHFTASQTNDDTIEDYENMTFWLTANPAGLFAGRLPGWFPDFLNLAIGVGLTRHDTREREVYISLDYRLKTIETRSVILNQVIAALDRFHFPAPAIRVSPSFVGFGFFF